MKFAAILFAALCIYVAFAHGDHGHDHSHGDHDSHVIVLTSSNFDAEIAKRSLTLVEFYAPWCGHCKKLAPEYEQAAHELEGNDKVALAKVDCTEQKELCGKFEVRGYPTIKLFTTPDAAPVDYQAARTSQAIVKFLQKQSAPALTDLATEDAIKTFTTSGEVAVVGFFEDGHATEREAFTKAASELRNDYNFGIVHGAEADALAEKFNIKDCPAIVVFKPAVFGEEPSVYEGEVTQEKLVQFVTNEGFPLYGEIGPENYQKYVERKKPLVWVFVDKAAEITTSIADWAKNVAKEFKGKLSFVHLDGVRWADHAKQFGVKATPGVVIEDREENKNYVLDQSSGLSLERLREHASDFVKGVLAPTVKSQEIPTDNDGPVKVVVGKSFNDIVLDDSKDVLVEFYAPWCGHCKTLAPKYDKLGEMFANEPSIVIAKVDATENDVPPKIKGFPTLIFYPAGDKGNPQTYNGDRSEEAMADFIRKHATTLKKDGKKGHDEL